MGQVCAFWDDELGEDGFAKVTRLHHQPEKLDEATRARGVICAPGKPVEVRPGWTVGLWVNPKSGAAEWRVQIDRDYRQPAPEYLMRLPVRVRVAARASDDPILRELLAGIDMLVADNAAMGLHPAGDASREFLGYLVEIGLMDQAVADGILSPVSA
jgi:hypothetical protein